ncbi:MAG: glycerol-3-phosphate 1-O-acyltransferase PlsY [Phycisphaerae bacterium]|nr:glycerol-3-phosphate 1-O-acyltransferase PlsY [Gemmatimonadaceae bacterium]
MTLVIALCVLAAYVIGSFPTALLVGKANGIDLRTVGSGNLGATNVLRTIGWKAGLLVYVVDMLKGVLPVIALPPLAAVTRGSPWPVVFGIAAIVGHVRPVFLLGKGGGKGVATASGMFLGLAPVPALVAFIAFVITTAISRFVSLGSLVGAVALVGAMWWHERGTSPLFIVTACVAAFVFFTHRENIGRLRSGMERKIGAAKKGAPIVSVPDSAHGERQ